MRKACALTLLFSLSTAVFAEGNNKAPDGLCISGSRIAAQQRLPPQTCNRLPETFASSDRLMGHTPPFQLTGSSIAIVSSTNETNTVNTIPHISVIGYSQGTGTSWANAQIPSGTGSVTAGGYTQTSSDVTTNLFHLGYTTTIRTNSTNTINDVSWATAVNSGPGLATATASGASTATASSQILTGTLNTSGSGTATSAGTATATINGPGTASARNVTWGTTVTNSTAVFTNNSSTSASSSVTSASGSTSQATAISAGTGSALTQASSTSSVAGATSVQINGKTTTATTSGTSSASSSGAANGGISTVITSSQQTASSSSNASSSNLANNNGGGIQLNTQQITASNSQAFALSRLGMSSLLNTKVVTAIPSHTTPSRFSATIFSTHQGGLFSNRSRGR